MKCCRTYIYDVKQEKTENIENIKVFKCSLQRYQELMRNDNPVIYNYDMIDERNKQIQNNSSDIHNEDV